MNSIIQYIIEHETILSLIASSFFGAFFAFLFFVVGEIWRGKRAGKKEWRKIYLNEHAHLERYLQYLITLLGQNIEFQKHNEEQYKNGQLAMRHLTVLPIRDDSSMKIADISFLNKIEQLMTDVRNLNGDIEMFNKMQDRMNTNVERFILEQKREDLRGTIEKSISMFMEESQIILRYERMLKDGLVDLLAENMFLCYTYRKLIPIRLMRQFKMKYQKDYRMIAINKQKGEILRQVEVNKIEAKEKYIKYGLV